MANARLLNRGFRGKELVPELAQTMFEEAAVEFTLKTASRILGDEIETWYGSVWMS